MYTTQKFAGVGVLTTIILGLVFLFGFAAVPALAQTADDYGVANSGNYCPKLSITMQRGARDVSYSGQVSELQKFLSDYYDIDPEEIVTGFFGRITQGYVQQFQREQGLPSFGIAGSMTRAAIAKVCSSNTSNNQTPATSGTSSSLSCNAFSDITYGMFDTDPGGRVSQLQTWLGIPSNTFGFGTYGPKTRAVWNTRCGGTQTTTYTPPTNVQTIPQTTNTTPEKSPSNQNTTSSGFPSITITSGSTATVPGTVNASYTNLPQHSQIWLVNTGTGQPYTAQWAYVELGGNGSTIVTIPSDVSPGYYMLRVNASSNPSDTVAQSLSFEIKAPMPTCTFTTDREKGSYKVGDTITLSWTNQNTSYVRFTTPEYGKGAELGLPYQRGPNETASVIAPSAQSYDVTLVAYNNYGSTSCSVTIPVN